MLGLPTESYSPNFFSIPDILATQERVPSEINVELKNLGFLDPGSDDPHLTIGTKMELPYWMVEGLRSSRRNIVTTDIPKVYKEGYREIMKADPYVVDLHKFGPHYYEFGRYLMKTSSTDGEDIGQSISQTFMARFRTIMDSAMNANDCDTVQEIAKLDDLERMMFREGQKNKTAMDFWLRRKTGHIKTSAMVEKFLKRKAVSMET